MPTFYKSGDLVYNDDEAAQYVAEELHNTSLRVFKDMKTGNFLLMEEE